jgi:hypothetical protein
VNSFTRYTLVCVALIGLIGVVSAAFADPSGRQAILTSGIVALAVQMAAFTVTRLLQSAHTMVGWSLGSGMRLIALVLYALVVARLWHAPVMAALLSFTAFLFVTTVVEPLFLKR